ncbi:Mov34/MPN/PAD-1 family protein [Gordonia sp. CPCC 205515]|uniref:Mov34/MPN/PAD-1 family protein n=1 Tax=Gordonia sp. CPCC 205515 TaxID=3140791 RepID=UPI003AF3C887
MHQRAADLIRAELSQTDDGRETGGILLGQTARDTATIQHAGRPGPRAIRTLTSFSRDRNYSQAFADACWSYDHSVWIGEWHSHPTGPPIPSNKDSETYEQLLADPDLDFDVFISIIVTPSQSDLLLGGWWYDVQGSQRATIRFTRNAL